MSQEQSDGEGSGVEPRTDRFIDATMETEVELCLPLEVDMEPDHIHKDVPIYLEIDDLDVVSPDSETQRRFGAKPKWASYRYPALRDPMGSYRGPGH